MNRRTSPRLADLTAQENVFKRAFEAADLGTARPLYDPAVEYVSPTVRLFGWPPRIEGVDRTLEFIELTVSGLTAIRYEAVEFAPVPDSASAFVRIHFDWTMDGVRLRSNYVVLYRYRDRRIIRQELYYDPSGRLEVLGGRD